MLAIAAALPALAQELQPSAAFREIRFTDAGLEGPAIVCQPAALPTLTAADGPPVEFVAECADHTIAGSLEITVPAFLPEGTQKPGQDPDYQLATPVQVSTGMGFTWHFDGLGPGEVSAGLTIGGEAGPDFELKCAEITDGVPVAEGGDVAQVRADLGCQVSAVYTATGSQAATLGVPEGSLVLPLVFDYHWLPSIFREDPPPDVGGAVVAYAIYGGAVGGGGGDVSLTALEMVQTVQTAPPAMEPANADPERRMPLIAFKSTILRVYLRGAQSIDDGVVVKIEARRNGMLLSGSPLSFGPFHVGPPDRSSAAGSVNIPLPWSWTAQGELELTVEAELLNGAVDPNEDDNLWREAFQFLRTAEPGATLDVYYAPVCYQPGGTGQAFCPEDVDAEIRGKPPLSQHADLTARLLPLPDFGMTYRRLPAPRLYYRGQRPGKDETYRLTGAMRAYYNHIDLARRSEIDQLVFWVPRQAVIDVQRAGSSDPRWSHGSYSGRVSWAENDRKIWDPRRTLVHEISHNLGLRHTNTQNGCKSVDSAADWPHKGVFDKTTKVWSTAGDSRIREPGFDTASGEFHPAGHFDYMSYCDPSWASPYHYKKLFENCFRDFAAAGGTLSERCLLGAQIPFETSAPLTPAAEQVSEADYFIVSGRVNATGSSAELDSVFRVTSSTPADPVGTMGDHCLVISGGGTELARHCFTVGFTDYESEAPMAEQELSIRIPAPAGATRIALTRDGRELAVAEASPAPPQIDITEPRTGDQWEGGMQMVRWDSSDADGDPQMFAVHYSPDGGGVWLPLDVDRRENELEVDPSQIEGGDNVLIRVLGSDGFNTTEERVGPIRVPQTPTLALAGRLDLHNALVGEAVDRFLTVRNTGNGPLTITSVASSSDVLTTITPAPITLWASESLDVRLRFTPPSAGPHLGTLVLESNDPSQPRAEIVFEGQGVTEPAADVAAGVSVLDFGEVNVGETASRVLPIENYGPAPATITSIATNQAAFTIQDPTTPYPLGVRRGYVTLAFTPATAGPVEGRVAIQTDSPGQPMIEVGLTGAGLTASGGGPRPTIHLNGVVDAAGFSSALAPGGIASIFGVDLASGQAKIVSIPLPLTLGGVRVLVDGLAAPLFYVSPAQINFQVPYETRTSGQVDIVVERNGVASAAEAVAVSLNAPAVFTNSAGEAIAQRHPALDSITAANPARPGDILILFVTGIGELTNPPATGSPAPGGPLAESLRTARVTVGGVEATVFFAGLTPGFAGLGQINFRVPRFAALSPAGVAQSVTALPLVVDIGIYSSEPVNLPIEGVAANRDVSVVLDEVLPKQAVTADHLVVRYTAHKPAGVGGTATLRVFLGFSAPVSTNDVLLHEHFIELGKEGDEQLAETGITLLDILSPGDYFVAVELEFPADPNPSNNLSQSLPLQIVEQRPSFDAAIRLTRVTPEQAGPGDSLDLEYTASAADGLTATLLRSAYLSTDPTITTADTLLNTRTVDVIDGAADIISRSNLIPRNTEPGDYFVGIILESQGDRNPANNTSLALPLRITGNRLPFDIGVTLTDVSPSEPTAGSRFTIRYSVQNPSGISGIFTREIRLSPDAVITAEDTLINTRTFALYGDAADLISENNTIPTDTAPGGYFVGLIVETGGDTNLANNTSPAPIPITVTAPAAALTSRPQEQEPASSRLGAGTHGGTDKDLASAPMEPQRDN